MRILYDHQMFAKQEIGGISRCFAELYKNMPSNVDAQISLVESDNVYIREMNLHGIRPKRDGINHFICRQNFPGKWRLYELYKKITKKDVRPDNNIINSIELIKKGDFDIFHPTYFDDYYLPYLNGKPFVLTIHDMIPELYPQYFQKDDFQIRMKRKLAPLANAIIAVSENTKQDIIRILGIPEEKVHVVYHGSSLAVPQKSSSPIQSPYILYVGDRRGYKNFIPFVKQVSPLLKQNKDLRVICTGHTFSKEEKTLFQEYGISKSFINIWAKDDAQLYSLYHHAICFIYPSEYEGFGIPILEAYQADCPVLLNNASCFPEIAKDAAIYFELTPDRTNLKEKIELVLSLSSEERKTLLSKQRTRLNDFCWKKSAEELSKIYETI